MSKLILVVDDENDIRTSLTGILEDEGFLVSCAASGVEALENVCHEIPDIVLLDIWMPGLDGLETLEKLKQLFPHLTVIMISGHGTIETAVRATKLGAFDFIEKPLSLDKVLITVNNALRMGELRVENEELRRVAGYEYELIGESPAMVCLRDQVMRVAPTSLCVLVNGENGSGKERVARSIHYYSKRCARPFVAINCAAIPEELIQNELFGHEKGALGGAPSQKKGKIDLADGGTLFLDEIGDMSLATQSRILGVIQEHCFQRVGGNRSVPADVRVIAASSRDIADEVRNSRFREDLFYLLNVIPLVVPPLRERREDIALLVPHFVEQFNRREGREQKTFSPQAMALLARLDWPGNVRELQNIVERVLIMVPGRMIAAEDLSGLFGDQARILANEEMLQAAAPGTLREAREEFERDFIVRKLEENDWNISRTAETIELKRSNLHRKIKSYGIDVKK
ncbi:sigma-54-dependent transcriptional regulator [Pelobacter propionicus]|uniref:Two component, sigma54 specific, transcriptional regulator, Fis family n=1 Tax=Pelobacter propionicus (strain DSM 2379 / NBRC 103807 / OttBd1) TaxID=338966 RepID=A1ALX1_PELPD|nr:sigma-54 dependent transcriptional regulator [Pelobacter propionicus]ABK98341.1 two component, sigma54 specific, transcriptional regulator, Fis family [Pelobacter propionicus DSM 2379]